MLSCCVVVLFENWLDIRYILSSKNVVFLFAKNLFRLTNT